MAECLFCKIVAGEIPSYQVYQDGNVMAFLDIHPCARGHAVLIPKKHFESLKDIPEKDIQKILTGLHLAIRRVDTVMNPDGMNIGINERPAAGQAVPHVHWHIIPRWKNDGGGSMHSIIKAGTGGDVKEVAKLFN